MRWFVRRVGPSVTLELKTQKMRIYDASVGIVYVLACWKGVWGEARGWRPCPQRYCDPASLVFLFDAVSLVLFFIKPYLHGNNELM